MERNDDLIDLGAASIETKGGTGQNVDEANGLIPYGLSND